MSVNVCFLLGNLGKDPELVTTASGTQVCNFSLATSETFTKDGKKTTTTEWHRVVLFNKLAEVAGNYLRKGSKCHIEGKIQTKKWQDANGNDRYTTQILGLKLQLLDQRGEVSPTPSTNKDQEYFNDDIPF
jgi:single-strand DNA-binding protein